MKQLVVGVVLLMTTVVGCSALALQPADFSWAAEEAITVDGKGMADAQRYAVSFSVKSLFLAELADSLAWKDATVRVIRDKSGMYFIAAAKFKNVYVFASGDGKLSLEKKILISETAPMADPKFNQRDSYIELLNGKEKLRLTKSGILIGGQK